MLDHELHRWPQCTVAHRQSTPYQSLEAQLSSTKSMPSDSVPIATMVVGLAVPERAITVD
jgi:hypothetical protein